jgi:hypothetical protein
MKGVAFTWWPWRVLALLTPAVATMGAAFFSSSHENMHTHVAAVLLSLLGAGNAYILAIASGRLDSAVVAIPCGAVAGFISIVVLPYFPLYAVLLCPWLVWIALCILRYLLDHVPNSGLVRIIQIVACSAPFVPLVFISMGLACERFPTNSPWAAVICYPLLCALSTAYDARHILAERINSFIVGFGLAIWCMIKSVIVLAIPACIEHAYGQYLDESVYIYAWLIAANYFFIKAMFPLVVRDQPRVQSAPKNGLPA